MTHEALPLADARRRLGRPPGRPRARLLETPAPPARSPVAEADTPLPQRPPAAAFPLSPRLLGIPAAGQYLGGLCEKTVRGLIVKGAVPKVTIGRRVLLDVRDLDRLIQANKEPGS